MKITKRVAILVFITYIVAGAVSYTIWYMDDPQGELFPINLVKDAWGFGPANPECFELGECDFFERPFDVMILPFEAVFGGFTLVILWGIIMAVLWLRVSNTMLTGVIGILLAATFARPNEQGILEGFPAEAQAIGWGLLIFAAGIAVYQILTVRVHFPTN